MDEKWSCIVIIILNFFLKNPIISFEMNFNQFTCFVTKSLKILTYMPCTSLNLYLFKDYKYVNKLDIVYSYI